MANDEIPLMDHSCRRGIPSPMIHKFALQSAKGFATYHGWRNGLRADVLALHLAGFAVGGTGAMIGFLQITMGFGHKTLLQIGLK